MPVAHTIFVVSGAGLVVYHADISMPRGPQHGSWNTGFCFAQAASPTGAGEMLARQSDG